MLIRKTGYLIALLWLLAALALPARAAEEAELDPYIQRMISYYQYYQEQAAAEIDTLLAYISAADPQQGELWRNIMDSWSYVDSEMEVHSGVLPEGLPEDDSLCIVVLGYGLNDNGSMKPELLDRLEVALASAEKYPNAYIAVTGGETSNVPGISEAGVMADWLKSSGIAKERLILEAESLTTTENAQNVYAMLTESYPQVNSIAVITSDYHIRWGCAMFTTVSHYASMVNGGRALQLVGNAVCETGTQTDSMYYQAWGISLITGIPFTHGGSTPSLLPPEQETEETLQAAQSLPEETQPEGTAEPEEKNTANPLPVVLMISLVAAAMYLLIPRKPRTKRQKPEWNRDT